MTRIALEKKHATKMTGHEFYSTNIDNIAPSEELYKSF